MSLLSCPGLANETAFLWLSWVQHNNRLVYCLMQTNDIICQLLRQLGSLVRFLLCYFISKNKPLNELTIINFFSQIHKFILSDHFNKPLTRPEAANYLMVALLWQNYLKYSNCIPSLFYVHLLGSITIREQCYVTAQKYLLNNGKISEKVLTWI